MITVNSRVECHFLSPDWEGGTVIKIYENDTVFIELDNGCGTLKHISDVRPESTHDD